MKMRITKTESRMKRAGFSLIEVLIGIFLVAVAVIGLAQLFLMGVLNNVRSGEITNGVFLAQQQIDYLRTLTLAELQSFPDTSRGESNDEQIDTNVDGTVDFRRVTELTFQDPEFDVRVMVFPALQADTARSALLDDPEGHKVRARMNTVIGR